MLVAVGLRAAALTVTCALLGCSLPKEQLALPTPISTPVFETASVTDPSGVALGDPASYEAEETRIYRGSGDFTGKVKNRQSKALGAAGKDGVTLDLVNASIAEAAKAVLGDVLGENYVVSDAVKGSVTLRTSRPVSPDGLLEIFESVLAAQNAAIVVNGSLYKILPRDEAIAAGSAVAPAAQKMPRGPGVSSEIVPLQYVAAAEMERILNSVTPTATITRVDSARNLLVVSGTRAELNTMLETIQIFDVDWMRGMSFGIFPVETSDVEAIAQELDTIFANDQDGPTKGLVRFVPNIRLKSILVISPRAEYLEKARLWIERIDLAGQGSEQRAFVYQVQYRPVRELAALLKKIYSDRGRDRTREPDGDDDGTVIDSAVNQDSTANVVPVPTVAQRSRAPGGLVVTAPSETPSGFGEAGTDTDALALVSSTVASGLVTTAPRDDRNAGISIVADESNNALVISATPSQIRRIRQVLSQIDTLPSQVLLEATIAEVTLNDNLKFGLRWFFEKNAQELRFTDSVLGTIAPVFPGFSYFLNLPDAKVVVNALAGITNVDVVSSPSMMVLNNKEAILQIGDEVPIATQSAVSVITPDAPIVNAITFRDTGVILKITPRVAEDGQIVLEIEQEVSDVKPTTSSTIDSPTIQQRRIRTTVAVNDGGSIVLAGMIQDRATRGRQQVPLAGDIPLLGNLFKNKDDTIMRTELLIGITPHVVKDNRQIALVAAEFRDRLNFSTRPQRATPPNHKEQFDRLAR